MRANIREYSMIAIVCGVLSGCGGDGTNDDLHMEPERRAAVQEARAYYSDLSECLTERGFPTTYDAENIQMQVSVDDAQESAFGQAQAGCQEIHGLPPEVPPFSERELTVLYEQSVEAYQCLVREGYEPAEPPTLEVFKANYRGGPGAEPYVPHMRSPETLARDGGPPSWPTDVCPLPQLTE